MKLGYIYYYGQPHGFVSSVANYNNPEMQCEISPIKFDYFSVENKDCWLPLAVLTTRLWLPYVWEIGESGERIRRTRVAFVVLPNVRRAMRSLSDDYKVGT